MQYNITPEYIIKEFLDAITKDLSNLENEYVVEETELAERKKRVTLKDLYEKLIEQNPELAKQKLPAIGKLTYENFKKLIYDETTRARFLKELGFDPRYLSNTKQQEIVKKIFTGKLSYKEGALLLSTELYNFIRTIYASSRSNKLLQNLYKRLGISLFIVIVVIIVIGSLTSLLLSTAPSVLGISSASVITQSIISIILGIVLNITINFISKIYLYLHSELNTTLYGFISLLAGVTGSFILVKISSFTTLVITIAIFVLWLLWEIEVLLNSKIETIYKKLHLDTYRRYIVLKTLKLNLLTRVFLQLLEKIEDLFNTKLVDKIVDTIIKIEDSSSKTLQYVENILDHILQTIKNSIITKYLSFIQKLKTS
jgi:hypothetical protein